jgi:hypothetical protein
MNDRFGIEVYARNSIGQPQRLLAHGRADLNGFGYTTSGPLGPASYPTGPAGAIGPVGPMGQPGIRGSRWYTAAGPPGVIPDTRVDGDMYLDESNGDVWRWADATATWARFTGV